MDLSFFRPLKGLEAIAISIEMLIAR